MANATTESPQLLGVASDAVTLGNHGVSWGFGIAKSVTNFGFGVASTCIQTPAAALESAAGPNPVSSVLQGVGGVVGFAHAATITGQDVAHAITRASLRTAKSGLEAAGARQGELLRLTIGSEAADAVMVVERLASRLAIPEADVPQLLSAASAWGALQKASAEAAEQQLAVEAAELPENSERWLRFAAATFGDVWLAGLLDGISVSSIARAQAVRQQGGSVADAAIACAGLEGHVEVLAFEQSTRELFAPGYLVAVDHGFDTVVVALRGTSSVADALADLNCEPTALELGGHEGTAHDGMLRAARHLEGTLAALAASGLARIETEGPRRIIICGHSLGAGVAALLAALWRDSGRFAGIDVRCIAFACPQVLSAELALAQSNHTTSVVMGDDLVPRFSFATAQDLRRATLVLSDPEAYGLPQQFNTQELLAAESRGDTNDLAAAYYAVRPVVCTSPGRLFPPGRLVHILPSGVRSISQRDVDELRISRDMASAHMPRRYLLAVQGVAASEG
mmetsp:Transcript_23906/g.59557  ORF Transcript_23906/g.59557 Transcript_23906/m.59557 type:complete len:511 (+) Transcript_23906:126-1658(+)|eukprot:CAMPEP_0115207888 /NCGR_PEP_ID=MMETSP0270-20121206/20947_1 /TAXON_ID=71861 /ORGANISM="Scrippsiella trochoidea, Strain CCMP3099" /LENGTH=510 /DNA_ID=CAMNT_0002621493 /DNA_START=104 /DNA_END=1636 /DNA_ORIENTATION=-